MSNPTDTIDPLDAVVADYLQQVEGGIPPDREALVAVHPDLADRLRAFFADLDRMRSHGESFRLPEVTLPEDFGDYEFLGELGRGGMGVVYRVRKKSLGRILALKMILSGALADASASRRFREEAEALSRLDHPNIVPVHEVGEHRGLPFFTMKLVEGQSLNTLLDRYANDPKAAAELLVKVCEAVQHAHQCGILHRDIKPGNVLIDAAGEPHVTDFGLARRLETARPMTSTGAVVGTPEYMAPEQAAGAKDLTTAADVYGLGGMLYALLTGQPPFRGDAVYPTLRAVIEEDPARPCFVRSGVPRDLEVICLKCLQKEPARRYPSAEALSADVGRWLRGEPIAARRVGRVERYRLWARRKPLAAALLKVSVFSTLLLVGGGLFFGWALSESNHQLRQTVQDLGEANQQLTITGNHLTEEKKTSDQRGKDLQNSLTALEKEQYSLGVATYQGKLALARKHLEGGDRTGALAILDGCQWDLRGWEFDHLLARCVTPDTVSTLPDRKEVPVAVAYSPGSNLLAWVGDDLARSDRRSFLKTKVNVDDWRNERDELGVVSGFVGEGHRGRYTAVALASNGRIGSSADSEGVIKVWRPPALKARAEEIGRLATGSGSVTGMIAGPDQKRLFIETRVIDGAYPATRPAVMIHELPNTKAATTVLAPKGRDGGPAIVSSDGELFLFAGCLWDSQTGKRIGDFGEGFTGTAIRPDGKFVVGLISGAAKQPENAKSIPPQWQPWETREVATGKVLTSSDEPAEWIAFAPSGDWTVAARAIRKQLNGVYWAPPEPKLELLFHKGLEKDVVARCTLPIPLDFRHPSLTPLGVGTQFAGGIDLRHIEIRKLDVSPDGTSVAAIIEFRGTVELNSRVGVKDEKHDVSWCETYFWKLPKSPTAVARPDESFVPKLVGYRHTLPSERQIDWDSKRPTVANTWTSGTRDGYAMKLSVTPPGSEKEVPVSYYTWKNKHPLDRPPLVGMLAVGDYIVTPDSSHVFGLALHRVFYRDEIATLKGHVGAVNAVALDSAGKALVSAGADGTVGVWDVPTAKRRHTLDGHAGAVVCVVLSPDAKQVISGGADGTIRLWDVATGRFVHKLEGHVGAVRSLAFLPGEKELVSGGDDATVRVWSVATGKLLHTFPGIPDAVGALGGAVLPAVSTLKEFPGHIGAVTGVGTGGGEAPIGKKSPTLVYSSGVDGKLRIWDFSSKKLRAVHDAHAGGVKCLCSDGERRVVTAGADGRVLGWAVWDGRVQEGGLDAQRMRGGTIPTVNKGAGTKGHGLAFTADGRFLVAPDDGLVKVWDVRTNQVARTIGHQSWEVNSVALSPDGSRLAVCGYDLKTGFVAVVDFVTGEVLYGSERVGVRNSPIGGRMADLAMKGMAFSPDGKYLLIGNTLLDARTGREVRVFEVPGLKEGSSTTRTFRWDHVNPFSADGKRVTLGVNPWKEDRPTAAVVWDVESGQVLTELKGVPANFASLAFDPTMDRVVVGNQDGEVAIFHATTGERLANCLGHRGEVKSVLFTRDGRRVISGGEDATIRLWDAQTGQELLVLDSEIDPADGEREAYARVNGGGRRQPVAALALNPEGDQLAAIVGNRPGTDWHRLGQQCRVWRIAKASRPAAVVSLRENVAFFRVSPDGQLAAAVPDGTGTRLETIDLATGKQLQRFDRQGTGLSDCLFLPDGRMVFPDGRVVDPRTGKELSRWNERSHSGNLISDGNLASWNHRFISVTPDGQRFVESFSGKINVCDATTGRRLAVRESASYAVPQILCHPDGQRIIVFPGKLEREGDYSTLRICALPQKDENPSPQQQQVEKIEELVVLKGHTKPLSCVDVSPNGKFIASGSEDGTVRIWDGASGRELKVLPTGGPVRLLYFSPDGAWLAAGGNRPILENPFAPLLIWSTADWVKRHTLRCDLVQPNESAEGQAIAVAWSADSGFLRAISRQFGSYPYPHRFFFHEWDVKTGRPIRRVREWGFPR